MSGGRGVVSGRIWSQNGDLVATVQQEGLVRGSDKPSRI